MSIATLQGQQVFPFPPTLPSQPINTVTINGFNIGVTNSGSGRATAETLTIQRVADVASSTVFRHVFLGTTVQVTITEVFNSAAEQRAGKYGYFILGDIVFLHHLKMLWNSAEVQLLVGRNVYTFTNAKITQVSNTASDTEHPSEQSQIAFDAVQLNYNDGTRSSQATLNFATNSAS